MSQHPDTAFGKARAFFASSKGASQAPLQPREYALHLPALPVNRARKTSGHAASIRSRRWALGAARVKRDHRPTDPQLLAANAMILFRIEGAVAQQRVDGQVHPSLAHSRKKVRPVIAWSLAHGQGRDKVCGVVRHHGQLGPETILLDASLSMKEMPADVMAFQTGGVDGSFYRRRGETQLGCPPEDRTQESVKTPFFTSRCSAFCRVVKWGSLASFNSRRRSEKSASICTMPR